MREIHRQSRLTLLYRSLHKRDGLEAASNRLTKRRARHKSTSTVLFFRLVMLDMGTCQKLRRWLCKTVDDFVMKWHGGTLYSGLLYRRWFEKMSDATWVPTCAWRGTRSQSSKCVDGDATVKQRTYLSIFCIKNITVRSTGRQIDKKTQNGKNFYFPYLIQ